MATNGIQGLEESLPLGDTEVDGLLLGDVEGESLGVGDGDGLTAVESKEINVVW